MKFNFNFNLPGFPRAWLQILCHIFVTAADQTLTAIAKTPAVPFAPPVSAGRSARPLSSSSPLCRRMASPSSTDAPSCIRRERSRNPRRGAVRILLRAHKVPAAGRGAFRLRVSRSGNSRCIRPRAKTRTSEFSRSVLPFPCRDRPSCRTPSRDTRGSRSFSGLQKHTPGPPARWPLFPLTQTV